MQSSEVSGAVRPIYGLLGVKRLNWSSVAGGQEIFCIAVEYVELLQHYSVRGQGICVEL